MLHFGLPPEISGQIRRLELAVHDGRLRAVHYKRGSEYAAERHHRNAEEAISELLLMIVERSIEWL
jgi:hypothetical protein